MRGRVTGITGAWLGVSAKKETPFVKLQCSMESGEDLYHTMWLTEKTQDRTFDQLVQYGYVGDTLSKIDDLGGGDTAANSLFVKREPVDVVIVNDEYTDKNGELKEVTKIECIVGMGFEQKLEEKDKYKFKKFDLMFSDKKGGKTKKIQGVDHEEEMPY